MAKYQQNILWIQPVIQGTVHIWQCDNEVSFKLRRPTYNLPVGFPIIHHGQDPQQFHFQHITPIGQKWVKWSITSYPFQLKHTKLEPHTCWLLCDQSHKCQQGRYHPAKWNVEFRLFTSKRDGDGRVGHLATCGSISVARILPCLRNQSGSWNLFWSVQLPEEWPHSSRCIHGGGKSLPRSAVSPSLYPTKKMSILYPFALKSPLWSASSRCNICICSWESWLVTCTMGWRGDLVSTSIFSFVHLAKDHDHDKIGPLNMFNLH